MVLGISTTIDLPYDEVIPKVVSALKKEGFGVLTEIDVKGTLKKKINVDFSKYVILGACNPTLAHRALQVEHELGLLLPCNVIVYEKDQNQTVVSAIDPMMMVGMIENPELKPIADEANEKLLRVIQSLQKSE